MPIALMAGILLLYTTFGPFLKKISRFQPALPHGTFAGINMNDLKHHTYRRIAIAIDFTDSDKKTISHAISQGGNEAEFLLIHVVETPMAFVFGKESGDFETRTDIRGLQQYVDNLKESGYNVSYAVGFGKPKYAIAEKVNEFNADLLVLGAHGHHWIKDLFLGTTIEGVRHLVSIPVLVVR
jgi:manganese transport protein